MQDRKSEFVSGLFLGRASEDRPTLLYYQQLMFPGKVRYHVLPMLRWLAVVIPLVGSVSHSLI